MNYNKLIFFVIVFCFASVQLSAQINNLKKTTPIPTKIKDVKPFSLYSTLYQEDKNNKVVNKHRDLINAIVNSKIKCTLDLFSIIRRVEAC